MCRLSKVIAGLVLAIVAFAWAQQASADHAVHFNEKYWDEWAYLPLGTINAYDCVLQDGAITNAAAEWNATGYVSIQTQTGNCNDTAYGIVWKENLGAPTTSCGSFVDNDGVTLSGPQGLSPDNINGGLTLYQLTHTTIYLGRGCPVSGDTVCSGYPNCDAATHEMAHAIGLGDHYQHDGAGNPSCCFTYTQATTILDYPHNTTITTHDSSDLNTLHRIAPYNEVPTPAVPLSFRKIRVRWADRSHNERNHLLEEQPYSGSFSQVAVNPKNSTQLDRVVSSPGFGYCYRLRPKNDWSLFGAYSSTTCANTPHAVQNVGGSFNNTSSYALCWNGPSQLPGNGVTSYRVLRQRWNNGTLANDVKTFSSTNTSCFGSVLYQSTIVAADYHHFAIRGCDSSGVCSYYWDRKSGTATTGNPDSYWVFLPCPASGSSFNCQYSGGSTNGWYHNHPST